MPSLIVNMSINPYSRLYIMVGESPFEVLTVTAISVIHGAFAQNTDWIVYGWRYYRKTRSVSEEEVEALCSLSPACIT